MGEQDRMQEYEALLRKRLRDRKYNHSLSVRDEAVRLAKRFGCDVEKARLAGLLHDVTKECDEAEQLQLIKKFGITLKEEEQYLPKVWHSITGAAFAEQELGIRDQEVLDAIRYHTTGRRGMSDLEKIIYLADCIEPLRDYRGVEEIRAAVRDGLDAAMITALTSMMSSLLRQDRIVSSDAFAARNELLEKREKQRKNRG